jgi:hypothetical protein
VVPPPFPLRPPSVAPHLLRTLISLHLSTIPLRKYSSLLYILDSDFVVCLQQLFKILDDPTMKGNLQEYACTGRCCIEMALLDAYGKYLKKPISPPFPSSPPFPHHSASPSLPFLLIPRIPSVLPSPSPLIPPFLFDLLYLYKIIEDTCNDVNLSFYTVGLTPTVAPMLESAEFGINYTRCLKVKLNSDVAQGLGEVEG